MQRWTEEGTVPKSWPKICFPGWSFQYVHLIKQNSKKQIYRIMKKEWNGQNSTKWKRVRMSNAVKILSKVHACMLSHFSCVQLFVTLWTIAQQAPLSMEFSRQQYLSGLPFPSLPYPGIESKYPALQAGALPSELLGKSTVIRTTLRWILAMGKNNIPD